MRFLAALCLSSTALACGEADELLGPLPPANPHLTVHIGDERAAAYLGGVACIGVQIAPSEFFISVHTDPAGLPSIALYFHDVTGPGTYAIDAGTEATSRASANYLVSTEPNVQYSSRNGVMQLDEYDPVTRVVAGRFHFTANRSVGTSGPFRLEFRLGSFRGLLQTAPRTPPPPDGSCL
jgi:hypothetical protein